MLLSLWNHEYQRWSSHGKSNWQWIDGDDLMCPTYHVFKRRSKQTRTSRSMSWARQSREFSSNQDKPEMSVWMPVDTKFGFGVRPSYRDVSVNRRFTSTTMGSCAVRKARTASSCGKLLTSVPFTWKVKVQVFLWWTQIWYKNANIENTS